MPQLSPLNWIFLFSMFWAIVSLMSVMIWWFSKTSFEVKNSTLAISKNNKWNW